MKKQQSNYRIKKEMANVTKIKKLNLEFEKRKKKKNCNSIYIVLKIIKVELKCQVII